MRTAEYMGGTWRISPVNAAAAARRLSSVTAARTSLSGRIGAQAPRSVNAELIIEMVARQYDTTPEEIIGKKRSQPIALPRQVAMYICRRMTSMSTTSIGDAFGGRDHTTVMHGCKTVEEGIKTDSQLRRHVEQLRDDIKA